MKKILLLFLVCSLFSCKKWFDGKKCYECDTTANQSGNYSEVGCFTKDEWNNYQLTDALGNDINKDQRCRKK